jgi:hypothetical protein
VVAAVSSEIVHAAAETVLMAVVNSATVAELLLVFPEFLVAFIARHKLEMLLLLGRGELGIIFWQIIPSLNSCHFVDFLLGYPSTQAAT